MSSHQLPSSDHQPTSRRSWTLIMALGALFVGFCLQPARSARAEDPPEKEYAADKGNDSIDASTFPKEQQQRYALFASKCSKCHTLARPLNTDKSAQQWARYVKRMAGKPKSNISPNQAKEVYLFLKFYQAKKDAEKSGAE